MSYQANTPISIFNLPYEMLSFRACVMYHAGSVYLEFIDSSCTSFTRQIGQPALWAALPQMNLTVNCTCVLAQDSLPLHMQLKQIVAKSYLGWEQVGPNQITVSL